jgi:hypothetical protein
MSTGLAIAAILAACGCSELAVLASRPGRPPDLSAGGTGIGADLPAALVSFVLANCSPGTEPYEATILDLAAQGLLAARTGPAGLEIATADQAATDRAAEALTSYERQVLTDTKARLTGTDGAPMQIIADTCLADVRSVWEPFEAALREDARRRGLSRPRLGATAPAVAAGFAATIGIGATAGLVTRILTADSRPHAGLAGPIAAAVVAVLILWGILGWLSRQDKLTSYGSALGAIWRRDAEFIAASITDADPDELRRAAFAVAAGLPVAGLALPITWQPTRRQRRRQRRGRRSIRPNPAQRPAQAWSSFSGSWRPVEIRVRSGIGMGGGVALLGGAAWAGLVAYGVSIPAGTGPLPLILGCIAGGLALAGVRALTRLAGMPARKTFDGQVIARWHEDDDSENGSGRTPYVAIDDGHRGWVFAGSGPFGQVGLGDLASVTVNPRSERLIQLTVTTKMRPDKSNYPLGNVPVLRGLQLPGPMEPLLTDAEAAVLVGPVIRNTAVPSPGGHNMIVKGRDGTLSLAVTEGSMASLNEMIGRRAGTRLADVGDEAWLLNKHRTVVARVGRRLVKVTVNSRGHTGQLDRLPAVAAMVAARLAGDDVGRGSDQVPRR